MPASDRPFFTRHPLAQGMVLSLSLHLAILAFVHPQRGQNGPQTLVINARLQPPPQAAPEDLPPEKTDSPAPPAPPPHEPMELPEPPPQQLAVPKPAPIQAEPTPPTPPVQALAQKTEIQAETVTAAPAPVPSAPIIETDKQPAPVTAAPPLPLPSPIDTTWYLARQVDRHPKAIGNITPQYPETARQRNQEGSLKLLVKIDDLGRVRDVKVVEAQPPGIFDEAAMAAFRDARFQPAMKDGRPVRYLAYMRVEFKLE